MTGAINGDLLVRTCVDTAAMAWSPSPSGSVWRKRVHLVGPPESGQVTSVVRYEPHSTFHAHDHPGGEEILVLDGVFSDEHGDWPAGTYLLNPEGFRHAPHSSGGCTLFVKLRQFPGRERRHVVIDTHGLPWSPVDATGCERKLLYRQDGFSDVVELQRWPPGSSLGAVSYADGAELFVLEGEFDDETGNHRSGCWLRFPRADHHRPQSAQGCIVYIKHGGLRYLESDVVAG